ncbi:DUF397 domain-containing protein [Streptomyces sp. NBC_01304]|uniref:DUF397 domain-containing protein n=1 Tax=Streptomyces sp. NBC_01304 TaxID=2903818 RepID=UPI002E11B50D|nr:DUF397 domain-containing protein [Streptomyces sp. NBC_01304]
MSDGAELDWFKSSYSDSSEPGDCVEVATATTHIHVRDSKRTSGPQLTFDATSWADFVTYAAKA